MTTHTPGPWRLNAGNEIEIMGENRPIARSLCGGTTGIKLPEAEANARLITAAPELLEALQAAVDCGIIPISSAREGGAVRHARQAVVADMVRDAINKATGDAS